MELKTLRFITLHCSATRPSQIAGVKEIRAWHKAKGWSDIGYHFVIRRNGAIEKGRPISKTGAHVAGWNADNLGICLEGGISETFQPQNNFTREQWRALEFRRDDPLLNALGVDLGLTNGQIDQFFIAAAQL